MIPKQGIEKAIEGGWKGDLRYKTQYPEVKEGSGDVLIWYVDTVNHEWTFDRLSFQEIALDSTFWQALGKALWWKDDVAMREFEDWRNHAHRFYDLVLTSGDVGKFWEDILSNKS